MRQALVTTALIALAAVVGIGSAGAAPPLDRYTYVDKTTQTHYWYGLQVPAGCATQHLYTVTMQTHSVITAVMRADRRLRINGASGARIEAVPDDPSLPTYTGTYNRATAMIVNSEWRATMTVTLRGSDGSKIRMHVVEHGYWTDAAPFPAAPVVEYKHSFTTGC